MERGKSCNHVLHWSENKDAAATVRCMRCRSQLSASHNLCWHPANESPGNRVRTKYRTDVPVFDILLLIPSWSYWHYFGARALFLMFKHFILFFRIRMKCHCFQIFTTCNKVELQRSQSVTLWGTPAVSLAGNVEALQVYKPYLTSSVRWFCRAQGFGGHDPIWRGTCTEELSHPIPGCRCGCSCKPHRVPLPGHAVPSWPYLLCCFLLGSISRRRRHPCLAAGLFVLQKNPPVLQSLFHCTVYPAQPGGCKTSPLVWDIRARTFHKRIRAAVLFVWVVVWVGFF